MHQFDFDHWLNLAKSNPKAFELEKKKALMDLVAQASPKNTQQLTALVDELCSPQEGSGLDKALRAQHLMLSSMRDLQSANIALVTAHSHHTQLVDDVTYKYSKLSLE